MATISAEFDTKEKTLVITMNGKKLKDIASVEFFVWGDEASASLTSITVNEDDSTRTITRVMADENGEDVITTENVETSLERAVADLFV